MTNRILEIGSEILNNEFKIYDAEALDILQHLFKVKKINDHTLHFVAKFLGQLDLKRFSKAVNASIDTFTLIRCEYNESKGHPYWKDRGYTADDIIEVVEAENTDKCIAKYICEEINEFNGPQLRIKIIRSRKNDAICVLMNHMLCDAAGFKDYLYMLSDIYTNANNETGKDYRITAMGNRKIGQIFKVFSLLDKLKIIFSKIDMSKHDSAKFELEGDLNNPFIEIRTINNERFCKIKTYAKEHGATINDIILAAYIRVLFQLFGRTLTIACAVDLRKYLSNHKALGICNLVTNINCSIGPEIGTTFEETFCNVKSAMDKQKSDISCVKSLIVLENVFNIFSYKIAEAIVNKNFSNALIAITNIGIIDKKRIIFEKVEILEAYITGSIKYNQYVQLAISTFDNKITLSINLYGTKADQNKISSFLDRFINELKDII